MEASNSIIEETTLAALLTHFYNLPEPIRCTFIRRSFNDHYIVVSGSKQFILRVYINNKSYISSLNDIHFELEFLEYLNSKKIPVISPIKNNNNQNLSLLKLNYNETRYLALFPYAKGSPINENLDINQSIKLGGIIAKLHLCSNNFTSQYSRYSLDVRRLVEEPLHTIEKYTRQFDFGKLSFFSVRSKTLIDSINDIPMDVDSYGIVHGDPNPSNFFFSNKDGFSLFDFDHSAFGYRIHDLAVIRLSFTKKVYNSVLKGYEQIRPLTIVEKDSIKVYSDILLIKKYSDIYNMFEITGADEEQKQLVTQNAFNTLKEMAGQSY
ncbi:phosphotransferase [Alteribacter keqinensis]|uniref:Aminoglycoside phosphotransferase n=1 Tax=Alteribacter keqinensis TaxID=2483800 RepID=A0A3M7TRF8_9BACI|nr:phosphotransferase [Alteribacter keqinensis]RNA66950.1 aminoglycoside phosphotransferase [Alteribacter keqinensis]